MAFQDTMRGDLTARSAGSAKTWGAAALAGVLTLLAVAATGLAAARRTPPPPPPQASLVSVRDGWASSAGSGAESFVSMTLSNRGTSAVTLTGATSPAAPGPGWIWEAGKLRIAPEVAPGQDLTFELFTRVIRLRVASALTAGQSLPFTLRFADGSTLAATVPVRDLPRPPIPGGLGYIANGCHGGPAGQVVCPTLATRSR